MNAAAGALRGTAIGIFEPSRERLESLAAWYEAEHASLVRFATLVCGDQAQAEDLVQDAFVKMYRAGARPDERGMKTYARATIVSLSRSAFRRRTREARVTALPPAPSEPDRRYETWEAIRRLTSRQRAVVVLRYYEDMTEREIAETLGVSTGSVKKHSDRAMRKLRELLGRES